MKVAIYARYSSDLQKDRSIEDQFALLEAFALNNQLQIVMRFEDRAKSGTSIMGRDGLMSLMEAARDGLFQAILVESLDRLSRDQEDMAGIFKRLNFYGVEIRTLHEGAADEIHVGVRSIVSSLYIKDLKHKVRRGMSGVVRDGKRAGGCPYGYRPIPGRPGELEIVESEASTVRRIFHDYINGISPKKICADLNGEGVPPPRGRLWGASTLNGSYKRGDGILRNLTYAGRIVWNRVPKVKDPDTGRRVSRVNPPEAWQFSEAPHLAILSGETFETAQSMRKAYTGPRPHSARRPKHLLSGLLKCGACGSSMSSQGTDKSKGTGKTRIQCSAVRNSGSCSHRRQYYAADVLATVASGLKAQLLKPDAIQAYLDAYLEERSHLEKQEALARTRLENELQDVSRQLTRLVDALAQGLVTAISIKERLLQLEADKAALVRRLEAAKEVATTVELHPSAVARYLKLIESLCDGNAGAELGAESSHAFKELVETVIVYPVSPGAPLDVEVRGYLSSLLNLPQLPPSGRYRGGNAGAG